VLWVIKKGLRGWVGGEGAHPKERLEENPKDTGDHQAAKG